MSSRFIMLTCFLCLLVVVGIKRSEADMEDDEEEELSDAKDEL